MRKGQNEFPLTLHPSGNYCKKVRGRIHYFGRDRQAALLEWVRVKDYLLAGLDRPDSAEQTVTVGYLCNYFLEACENKVAHRELKASTYRGYKGTCKLLLSLVPRTTPVSLLTPETFAAIRDGLQRGIAKEARSAIAVRGHIASIRTMFNMAFKNRLIPAQPHFGSSFDKPREDVIRRETQAHTLQHGERFMEPWDVRRLLTEAKPQLSAMIMLGINCAYGATDCAELPAACVDFENNWIQFPRPKTAINRECPLWPETKAALLTARADREGGYRKPPLPGCESLFFVTRNGRRWVHFEADGYKRDAVATEFSKLLRKCDLYRRGLGFYVLRHCFRTIAEQTEGASYEREINLIMGHADPTMAGNYIRRFGPQKLTAVSEHVRHWLFESVADSGSDDLPQTAEPPATLPFRRPA